MTYLKKRIAFVMTERNLESGFYMWIASEEFLSLFRNGKKGVVDLFFNAFNDYTLSNNCISAICFRISWSML